METVADIAPLRSQPDTVPKRCRRQDPGILDKRKVIGRRVAELKALYVAELLKVGAEVTAVRLVEVESAAAAQVTAEVGRRRFLEQGVGRLSAVLTAERHAALALRRLLPSKPVAQRSDDGAGLLHDHLEARARAKAAEGASDVS